MKQHHIIAYIFIKFYFKFEVVSTYAVMLYTVHRYSVVLLDIMLFKRIIWELLQGVFYCELD